MSENDEPEEMSPGLVEVLEGYSSRVPHHLNELMLGLTALCKLSGALDAKMETKSLTHVMKTEFFKLGEEPTSHAIVRGEPDSFFTGWEV